MYGNSYLTVNYLESQVWVIITEAWESSSKFIICQNTDLNIILNSLLFITKHLSYEGNSNLYFTKFSSHTSVHLHGPLSVWEHHENTVFLFNCFSFADRYQCLDMVSYISFQGYRFYWGKMLCSFRMCSSHLHSLNKICSKSDSHCLKVLY